jgi:hypothetical protein
VLAEGGKGAVAGDLRHATMTVSRPALCTFGPRCMEWNAYVKSHNVATAAASHPTTLVDHNTGPQEIPQNMPTMQSIPLRQ